MRSPTDRTSSRFSTSTIFPTMSASLSVSLLLVSIAPCSASPRKNNGLILRLFLTSFFCAFSEPRVVVALQVHVSVASCEVDVSVSLFPRFPEGSSPMPVSACAAVNLPPGRSCGCWSFQGCHQTFLVATSVLHSLNTSFINPRFLSLTRTHLLA